MLLIEWNSKRKYGDELEALIASPSPLWPLVPFPLTFQFISVKFRFKISTTGSFPLSGQDNSAKLMGLHRM